MSAGFLVWDDVFCEARDPQATAAAAAWFERLQAEGRILVRSVTAPDGSTVTVITTPDTTDSAPADPEGEAGEAGADPRARGTR